MSKSNKHVNIGIIQNKQIANRKGVSGMIIKIRKEKWGYINSKQMRKAVEEIMRAREVFPDILLYTYFDVLGEGEPQYHHPIDKFNMPCPARKNGFITYSGDFFPCDFLRWAGEKFFCGNIFKGGDFKKLWKDSSTLQYFQNLKHEKCYRCGYYMKKCYGGCVCNAIASGGSSDDILCFIDV